MLPALAYARRSWRVFGGADAYVIGGASPELVAAFTTASDGTTAGEYYRKASSETTFDGLFTHSVSGLLTMFDSSGTLVWAPHNLLPYSEDASVWATAGSLAAKTVDTLTDDATSTYHAISRSLGAGVLLSGGRRIISAGVQEGTIGFASVGAYHAESGYVYATINLATGLIENSGAAGSSTLHSATVEGPTSDGYYRVILDVTYVGSDNPFYVVGLSDDGAITNRAMKIYSGSGDTLKVKYFQVSRNDLGGMVNNPDRGDSYVPTTSAAVYLPRRNAHYYNGSSWVKGGLRFESAAATNLLANNTDLSGWTTASVTLSQTGSTAPDGSASWRITDDATTVTHRAYFANAFTVGAGFTTWSVFVKQGTARYAVFGHGTNSIVATVNVSVIFDTQTGTFSDTGNGPSATYIDTYRASEYGNGWWRIEFSSDLASANYDNILVGVSSDGTYANLSYSGSGEYIDFWMPQIEVGSVASSPIPTSGSTVTRAAETLTIAGADTPANTTAMSISMKGLMTYADNSSGVEAVPYRWRKGTFEQITVNLNTSTGGTGRLDFLKYSSISDLGQASTANNSLSPGVNVPLSLASRNTVTAINGALNGTAVSAAVTTAFPNLSATVFDLGQIFNGYISEFRMWGADIGDSGIAEVTA